MDLDFPTFLERCAPEDRQNFFEIVIRSIHKKEAELAEQVNCFEFLSTNDSLSGSFRRYRDFV